MPMRLDLLVKLKCQSSTIILSVGVKYSVCDLQYFVTSITMPDPQSGVNASHTVDDVGAPSGISSPNQAVNSISKPSFRWGFV